MPCVLWVVTREWRHGSTRAMAQPAMILVMIIGWIHSLLTSVWVSDQLELPESRIWAAPARAGGADRRSSFNHSANHICRASPPNKLGRTPVRASPLALGLIVPLAKLRETPIMASTLVVAVWGKLFHPDQARLCHAGHCTVLHSIHPFSL